MAKGNTCCISNCKNIITHKGTVCGTHKWRMAKFNSYDLPAYSGKPNYYKKIEFPEGKIKHCKKHGYLTKEEVYTRYYKGNPNYSCKPCYTYRHHKNKFQNINYTELLANQRNVCAICKSIEEAKSNNKKSIKKLAIDHCHKTLKIRGILCQNCNHGLGVFKDSIELLESAIQYLKKNTIRM